jgi:hypothetical protein
MQSRLLELNTAKKVASIKTIGNWQGKGTKSEMRTSFVSSKEPTQHVCLGDSLHASATLPIIDEAARDIHDTQSPLA